MTGAEVGARLVGGSTFYSMFRLPVPVYMPLLTHNYFRIMRYQWRDIEFVFIDKISMVPYEIP